MPSVRRESIRDFSIRLFKLILPLQKREFTRLSRDVLTQEPLALLRVEAGAVAFPRVLATGYKNAVSSSELRSPPCRARVAAGRTRAAGRRGLVHWGRQRPQERALGKLCV